MHNCCTAWTCSADLQPAHDSLKLNVEYLTTYSARTTSANSIFSFYKSRPAPVTPVRCGTYRSRAPGDLQQECTLVFYSINWQWGLEPTPDYDGAPCCIEQYAFFYLHTLERFDLQSGFGFSESDEVHKLQRWSGEERASARGKPHPELVPSKGAHLKVFLTSRQPIFNYNTLPP